MLSEAKIEERMNAFRNASTRLAGQRGLEYTESDIYEAVAEELAFILQKDE